MYHEENPEIVIESRHEPKIVISGKNSRLEEIKEGAPEIKEDISKEGQKYFSLYIYHNQKPEMILGFQHGILNLAITETNSRIDTIRPTIVKKALEEKARIEENSTQRNNHVRWMQDFK